MGYILNIILIFKKMLNMVEIELKLGAYRTVWTLWSSSNKTKYNKIYQVLSPLRAKQLDAVSRLTLNFQMV